MKKVFILLFFCAYSYAGISVAQKNGFMEVEASFKKPHFSGKAGEKILSSEDGGRILRRGLFLPGLSERIEIPEGFAFEKIEIVEKNYRKLEDVYFQKSSPRPINKKSGKSVSLSKGEELPQNFLDYFVQEEGEKEILFLTISAPFSENGEMQFLEDVRLKIFLKETFAPSPLQTDSTGWLLITSNALKESFGSLLAERASEFSTYTITTEEIYLSYSGNDEQEKIRNCIKDFYDNENVRFVLLGGDAEIIPVRGVYAKVEGEALKVEPAAVYEDYSIPCDLYYAALNGSWDFSGNKIFGELTDRVDFIPEVFLGRATVSNEEEAKNFCSKVINYSKTNDYRVISAACWLDSKNDGKEILENFENYFPEGFDIIKMYESEWTLTKSGALSQMQMGCDFLNHAGHGNYDSIDFNPYLSISDVQTLSNEKPFFVYSIACEVAGFDRSDSIAEEFIKSGYASSAFVGNARFGWYDDTDPTLYNGEFMKSFYEKLFEKSGDVYLGEIFCESKKEYIADSYGDTPYRWIQYSLNLLGDPAMKFSIEPVKVSIVESEIITEENDVNTFTVQFENYKSSAITNVKINVSTEDPYVTVLSSSSFAGDVSSGGNVISTFSFSINGAPCSHIVQFKIFISADNLTITRTLSLLVSVPSKGLAGVYCWPNPSRGEPVKFSNIPINSSPKIRIFSLSGETVRTLREGDGISSLPTSMKGEWNLKNAYGKSVASGVYYYFLETSAGSARGKLAIIK